MPVFRYLRRPVWEGYTDKKRFLRAHKFILLNTKTSAPNAVWTGSSIFSPWLQQTASEWEELEEVSILEEEKFLFTLSAAPAWRKCGRLEGGASPLTTGKSNGTGRPNRNRQFQKNNHRSGWEKTRLEGWRWEGGWTCLCQGGECQGAVGLPAYTLKIHKKPETKAPARAGRPREETGQEKLS